MVHFPRTKRGIGRAVLVAFVVAFVFAAFLPSNIIYTPQSVELPVSFYGGTAIQTYPSVSYDMYVDFKADGGFSVGNTAFVKVVMTNVNVTGVLGSYCCASVSGAVNIPPIKGTGNGANTVFASRIRLTSYPNGSYIGSDYIKFDEAGGQNVTLAPEPNLTNPAPIIIIPAPTKNLPYPYNLTRSEPAITVSDATNTVGIDSTRFIGRITLLIGAFSIVLLQPVFEAILLPDQPARVNLAPPPTPSLSPQGPQPTTLSQGQMKRKLRREERRQKEARDNLQESEPTKE